MVSSESSNTAEPTAKRTDSSNINSRFREVFGYTGPSDGRATSAISIFESLKPALILASWILVISSS